MELACKWLSSPNSWYRRLIGRTPLGCATELPQQQAAKELPVRTFMHPWPPLLGTQAERRVKPLVTSCFCSAPRSIQLALLWGPWYELGTLRAKQTPEPALGGVESSPGPWGHWYFPEMLPPLYSSVFSFTVHSLLPHHPLSPFTLHMHWAC